MNSFSNLDYRFGDYEGSATIPAYDIDTYGITVGADYRLNQNLVLGTALNYIAYKSEFATFAGEADQTGYSLSGLPPARAWSGSGHGARPGRDRYANRGAGVNRFGWPARSWRVWVAAAAVCAQRKKGATKCT